MKFNPITIIIIISFMFPIVRGCIVGFSAASSKKDIASVFSSVSFAVAIFICVRYLKNIIINNENSVINSIDKYLPANVVDIIKSNPAVVFAVVLMLAIYLIYKILEFVILFLINLTIYQIIDKVEGVSRNKDVFFKRILGGILELPRGICYLFIVVLFLNIGSMLTSNNEFNKYLTSSKVYSYLCKKVVQPITNSDVARSLPEIIGDSLKVVVKQNGSEISNNGNTNANTIVYYNGVTLDEAIQSNSDIDSFAKKLTSEDSLTIDKAKDIYNWEGSNIAYDYDKANEVLNNDYNVKSGAIPTFNTKKGICFDYASLYVAMCRANNIKVRLVTGEGFNGVNWVSHAWNMVYIPEEKKWINVDTTFAKGGNYFDSRIFDLDHRNAKIIGEW